MNYTQNQRIMQVNNKTLVVGIDVGSETHYARCFDNRGIEYSNNAYSFSNDSRGFLSFTNWIEIHLQKSGKTEIIIGMEPTGHYWFNLGEYLKENKINIVFVNPHHVKKSKELDDNLQSKNDRKDPKVIAGLVKDGRYQQPYIPEGIYAELRNASKLRSNLSNDLCRLSNKIQRWLSIYFPEYKKLYTKFSSKSSLILLKTACLPSEIVSLGAEKINELWRKEKLRAVGMKRAIKIVKSAEQSIGSKEGTKIAKIEFLLLLEEYERKLEKEKEILEYIESLLEEIPESKKLLSIKGIGLKTVSGFLAEVGDIRRFSNPKQIQKLAGLAIVSNSSGKHKGKGVISRRGRKHLRHILFEVSLSLVGKNDEFKELHAYYTTRKENPLKKMQSLIAISCKVIRVFYAIIKTGTEYDGKKLMSDIKRVNNNSYLEQVA